MISAPGLKRLLLVGGGHSHIEVVRRFGAAAPHGAGIVLASPARYTAYSGMLPGLIAGHYAFNDCHIDLETLCRACGVTFRPAAVTGLDPVRSHAVFGDGVAHHYDWLSLDVGSTPDTAAVTGAHPRVLPVKPVAALLEGLGVLIAAAHRSPQNVVVVGGGAGGVELAFALYQRLQDDHTRVANIHLVTDASRLLPAHSPRAARIVERLLAGRGIRLHPGCRVVKAEDGALQLEDGTRLATDWSLWTTSASAPAWLAASGLATDTHGFVSVDDRLRSISHANVFAAGDCASLAGRPLPKSGVYAVRQGPPLAANLRNALAGKPLVRYQPQRRTLSIISTGDRRAVACWGRFVIEGAWVWRWKDRIDRRFMAQYRIPA